MIPPTRIGLLYLSLIMSQLLTVATTAACAELFTFVSRGKRNFLAAVDPATGEVTPLGHATAVGHCPGLDFRPSDPIRCYGLKKGVLRAFNSHTGRGAKVHEHDTRLAFHGFAISSDDEVYGLENGENALYRLDFATGEISLVGRLKTHDGQLMKVKYVGMDFAPDGTLYLIESRTDALYVVNPKTAVATPVGEEGGRVGLDLGITDLAITADGTIYASANVDRKPVLFTLDPTTGKASSPKPMQLRDEGKIIPSALGWRRPM